MKQLFWFYVECVILAFAFGFFVLFFDGWAIEVKHKFECHRIIHQTDERIPQHCFTPLQEGHLHGGSPDASQPVLSHAHRK